MKDLKNCTVSLTSSLRMVSSSAFLVLFSEEHSLET